MVALRENSMPQKILEFNKKYTYFGFNEFTRKIRERDGTTTSLEFAANDLINPILLERLDQFRFLINSPIQISRATDSIGRIGGPNSTSQHNISVRGFSNAIDVMICDKKLTWTFLLEKAKEAGFTGIGAYPHWKPCRGMHLDVRPLKNIKNIATWSQNKQRQYVAYSYAVALNRG